LKAFLCGKRRGDDARRYEMNGEALPHLNGFPRGLSCRAGPRPIDEARHHDHGGDEAISTGSDEVGPIGFRLEIPPGHALPYPKRQKPPRQSRNRR